MTLPTFLGIGTPKSGTTWLHHLLSSHPLIYVPQRRKEVRFFHRYYDRGTIWYESFFPSNREARKYKALGEITPGYLYCTSCPMRISKITSINKFLLILRNPTERAYSSYRHWVQSKNYTNTFESFLTDYKPALQYGFYSTYLSNYLNFFNKEQFLILIFEQAVNNIVETKTALANFLDVPFEDFPQNAGHEKANKSYLPRFRPIYGLINKATDIIRYRYKQDFFVDGYLNIARKLGVKRIFGNAGSLSFMRENTRKELNNIYQEEIKKLESLLEMDLKCWRYNL